MTTLISFFSTRLFLVLALIISAYVGNYIIKWIFRTMVKSHSIHMKFLKNFIQGILVVTVTILISNCFETTKQLTSVILASSGLLVAVLGFAAQESLSNIINGFFISVFKPFEIGDRVLLQNNAITGVIEDITLRHTVIKRYNQSRVLVPNSVMNKEIIENSTFKATSAGNMLDIAIAYDSDIPLAIQLMQQCIKEHPLFIDLRTEEEIKANQDEVTVLVKELSSQGITLRATVVTQDVSSNFKACSDIRLSLKDIFDKHGIKFACPSIQISTNTTQNIG